MIIFYNAGCSKCQEAVKLLEGAGCPVEIREYLKDPPSPEELQALVARLGCRPFDLVRTSEPLFVEQFQGRELSDTGWIEVLSRNPILIERPIVVDGEKAIIGRPPVKVLELVSAG